VNDLLSALSLLLAVIGVLYGLWYREILDVIGTPVPDHPENRRGPYLKVKEILLSRALPLSVASASVALVFLPPSIALISESISQYSRLGGRNLAHYDPIGTAFCLVELFVISFAVHSASLVGRLVLLLVRLR
jgi:hypothetical protein